MSDIDLSGFRVAILATDGFEESELTEPMQALQDAGAEVVIASFKVGPVQGFRHDVKGASVDATLPFEKLKAEDFDAVQLPGGTINADTLRMAAPVQSFLRQMEAAKKPIAAICHAPWLLVSAGLVSGRKLTSYYTIQDDIKNAGGTWIDEALVADDNWVTSRQPKDLPVFNKAMLQLFSKITVTVLS